MESKITHPYSHDQAEDPIKIHHPEEEEHQENGASKMMRKVREKAKKIKNSLTKHGHGHDQDHDDDVEEEDDEYDEQDSEVDGAPVYESSTVRSGVTGQPESLSHPGETGIPAPEEIIPPGTKVFPVVSTDYTKPVEPEPLRDASYGHEAASHPFNMSDLSDRGESREAHHEPMKTHMPLFPETEDVTRTFAPGEDEYLGGQRKVNVERPKGLEEDPTAPGGGSHNLSGVSNYETKVADPTQKGGGEARVPGIEESLGRMKVTDDQQSGLGFERDLPKRSHQIDLKNESGGDKNSPTGLGSGSIAGLGEDFPAKSYELDIKKEPEDSTTGFRAESGTRLGESFLASLGSHGYEKESEAGLEKNYPASSDDVKVETVLGRDLPTGTHDQLSPELCRPKVRDDFDSKADEPKPSTFTEKFISATSIITEKAVAAKNAVASSLGYSGETTGAGDQQSTAMTKLPLTGGGSGAEETHGGENKGVTARDYLAEKLTPGEEDKALSEVIAEKLHMGGGEKKVTATKEVEVTVEKIPSDQVSEEINHGGTVVEEGKGGGMVGKIKGWLGGTTPSDSVEKSSQSLGSTVGTMGFLDSGSGGAVPGQGGRQESGK